jgi:hypothetical protein
MSGVVAASVIDGDAEVQGQTNAPTPPRRRGGGPRTIEGRFNSSKNAIKDSLRSKVHLPDEEKEAIARHLETMTARYAPADDQERWWVGKMSVAAARVDRCQALMPADLGRIRLCAAQTWDLDRQTYVEQLAARLPREPRRVIRALLGSYQGVRYVRDHWEMLQDVLETCGSLTDEQYELALNLLGVPHALRVNNDGLPTATDTEGLSQLAADEVAGLVEMEELQKGLDGRFQELAVMGLPLEEDATTRRLRRAEAEAKRDLNRALGELLRLQSLRLGGLASPGGPSPSSPPRPDELPALPARPQATGRAKAFLERYEELYPPSAAVWTEMERARQAEATGPEAQPEPEPEPEPVSEPQPEAEVEPAPTPVIAAAAAAPVVAAKADTRPLDQAEYTRRNRRRRRMVEKLERGKAKKKGR